VFRRRPQAHRAAALFCWRKTLSLRRRALSIADRPLSIEKALSFCGVFGGPSLSAARFFPRAGRKKNRTFAREQKTCRHENHRPFFQATPRGKAAPVVRGAGRPRRRPRPRVRRHGGVPVRMGHRQGRVSAKRPRRCRPSRPLSIHPVAYRVFLVLFLPAPACRSPAIAVPCAKFRAHGRSQGHRPRRRRPPREVHVRKGSRRGMRRAARKARGNGPGALRVRHGRGQPGLWAAAPPARTMTGTGYRSS